MECVYKGQHKGLVVEMEMFCILPLSASTFCLFVILEFCKMLSFFFFLLFGAAPSAYGGSHARGQLELQPPAYITAIATWDPSHICDLYHSSWQCQILNPLSEARHRTCNLMVPRQILFRCATVETPKMLPLR